MLHRLLHAGDEPVWIRVAQRRPAIASCSAPGRSDRAAAEWGIERMRQALGIDQDLRAFYERFRFDPLIGPAVRADPGCASPAGPSRSRRSSGRSASS